MFLLIDYFVIDECKLCNKKWKRLAMVLSSLQSVRTDCPFDLQIEKINSGLSVARVSF